MSRPSNGASDSTAARTESLTTDPSERKSLDNRGRRRFEGWLAMPPWTCSCSLLHAARLNRNELDVHACGGSERAEIIDVGRKDVVSVAGERDERRIDRIHGLRRFEQHACAATQLG